MSASHCRCLLRFILQKEEHFPALVPVVLTPNECTHFPNTDAAELIYVGGYFAHVLYLQVRKKQLNA